MTDPAPGRKRAVVLDVDGTLLDTVYLHVHAWWEAFDAEGHRVRAVDIHHQIGRGAEDLVTALLGRLDEAVVEGHATRWAELRGRCRPHDGARDLLAELRRRGLSTVLATSGSDDDIEAFLDRLGGRGAVDGVVGDSQVERSKPAPDIIRAALAAVGAEPADAVVVGDSRYDVEAARQAGAGAVGLLCGGIAEGVLRDAGAHLVAADPAALLADPDRWLPEVHVG